MNNKFIVNCTPIEIVNGLQSGIHFYPTCAHDIITCNQLARDYPWLDQSNIHSPQIKNGDICQVISYDDYMTINGKAYTEITKWVDVEPIYGTYELDDYKDCPVFYLRIVVSEGRTAKVEYGYGSGDAPEFKIDKSKLDSIKKQVTEYITGPMNIYKADVLFTARYDRTSKVYFINWNWLYQYLVWSPITGKLI